MNYLAPTSVAEAVQLLSDNPGAKVFAGATDIIPQIRAGRPAPPALINLKTVDRLNAITATDDGWVIGAAVATARLTENAELAAAVPGLVEAAGLIGSDQIQNRSSLGGNLCNASPAADSVPAMMVNGLQVVVASPSGERTVSVDEITTGPGTTSLAADEIVVEFIVPRPPANSGDAYLRLTPRTEMDIAVVGAGARITLDAAGICQQASVALGAVAPTAVRVPDAEAALVGNPINDASLAAAAQAATAAANPIDDKRGTAAYRRHVSGVLTRRAIQAAAARATNGAAS